MKLEEATLEGKKKPKKEKEKESKESAPSILPNLFIGLVSLTIITIMFFVVLDQLEESIDIEGNQSLIQHSLNETDMTNTVFTLISVGIVIFIVSIIIFALRAFGFALDSGDDSGMTLRTKKNTRTRRIKHEKEKI